MYIVGKTLCPIGWHIEGSSCYQYYEEELSPHNADNKCHTASVVGDTLPGNGHLVHIQTNEEIPVVQALLPECVSAACQVHVGSYRSQLSPQTYQHYNMKGMCIIIIIAM